MSDLCGLIWCALIGPFRSRAALEAEILVLRPQLNVLRRESPKRLAFGSIDRLVFAGLYRVAPGHRAKGPRREEALVSTIQASFSHFCMKLFLAAPESFSPCAALPCGKACASSCALSCPHSRHALRCLVAAHGAGARGPGLRLAPAR